jgi:hypothetical protein
LKTLRSLKAVRLMILDPDSTYSIKNAGGKVF